MDLKVYRVSYDDHYGYKLDADEYYTTLDLAEQARSRYRSELCPTCGEAFESTDNCIRDAWVYPITIYSSLED